MAPADRPVSSEHSTYSSLPLLDLPHRDLHVTGRVGKVSDAGSVFVCSGSPECHWQLTSQAWWLIFGYKEVILLEVNQAGESLGCPGNAWGLYGCLCEVWVSTAYMLLGIPHRASACQACASAFVLSPDLKYRQ